MVATRATNIIRTKKQMFNLRPRIYPGASLGLKSSGPIMLPAEAPMKTMADVDFRLVSPAVFCADHA